jgi:hypothetical protein
MRSTLILILLISISLISNLYSQEIKAKLRGHLATDGFTVVDDEGKVLFKVTGEGNVGINTSTPTGIFDIQGGTTTVGTGKGRGISLIAEGGEQGNEIPGGNIFLKGGNSGYGDAAEIIIGGGKPTGTGGDINIYSGHGPEIGGNINIISSVAGLFDNTNDGQLINKNNLLNKISSNFKIGDIKIGTDPYSNMFGGKISIFTGNDNGGGGDIEILTGMSGGAGNKITLSTTISNGGADIILEAGKGTGNIGGEDIILTPNSNGGLVIVNGSGTYSGSWTSSSDRRYKKNIQPIENSLEKVKKLKSVSYEWKTEDYPNKKFQSGKQIGLIAQEVEKVEPILVSTDSDGYKSIDYAKISILLIDAVQEQQKTIEELKKEIFELKYKSKNDVSNTELSGN